MKDIGWRTIIIDSSCELTLADSQMIVHGKESVTSIPLIQIKDLVITNPACSMSVPLINALSSYSVNVLFCDEKRNPHCNIVTVSKHSNCAGHIHDQAEWKQNTKDSVWEMIILNKIQNQQQMLERFGLEVPAIMQKCVEELVPGDTTNKEGQAARAYFQTLLGPNFIRHKQGEENYALDYGYTVLRSAFSRGIAMHGYSDALGIHHRSRSNPYNLSCDLIEPFRPVIDEIVFMNRDRGFETKYKHELIGALQKSVRYKNKKMALSVAVDQYILDVTKVMNECKSNLGEVRCIL